MHGEIPYPVNCTREVDPVKREKKKCDVSMMDLLEELYAINDIPNMAHSILRSYVLLFLVSPGVVSNIFILLVMAKERRSSIRILFQTLAASDIVFIILQTWFLVGMSRPTVGFDLNNFWHMSGFFLTNLYRVAKKVSIFTILLMTLERYLVICKPLKYGKAITVRRTMYAVGSVILASFSYVCTTRWEEFSHWRQWNCDPCTGYVRHQYWYFQHKYTIFGATYRRNLFLNMVDWFVEFVVPWPILVVLNGLIIHTLFKASRSRKALGSDVNTSEKEVTLCLIIVVVMYFILELPRNSAHMTQLLRLKAREANPKFGKSWGYWLWGQIYNWMYNLGAPLAILNSSVNLYIYILTGKRFRKMFFELFRCCKRPRRGNSSTSKELTASTELKTV